MSAPLTLHLSDDASAALRREAEAVGTTPEDLALRVLEGRFTPAPEPTSPSPSDDDPFARLFGSVSGPVPGGTDNEAIDADLAREYANDHEEP